MNSKNIFSMIALSSILLLNGCGDSASSGIYNPRNPNGSGPAVVSLTPENAMGSAESYVILSKTGISNVTGSNITGDIAVSPAAASYITGFSLSADASNVFSTSSSVTGNVYAADYAVPTPSNLTTSIGSMETAYTDAASRNPPDYNELATGNIGSLNLAPGLYKWTSNVTAPVSFTLTGSATDVWIFQIAGNLTMASGVSITLAGGALPKNIFWQVAGQVNLGTSAHFEGIILCKTAVTLGTLASMNGRILSQTAVTLDDNVITEP